jgi:hypothetical protein
MSSRKPAPDTGTYQSPLTESCQRNFIVLLDGRHPDRRQQREHRHRGIDRRDLRGSAMAAASRKSHATCTRMTCARRFAGTQNVSTYTIGFGPEVSGSAALQNTAAGAGGVFYEASDTATAHHRPDSIVRTILDFNTSFTAAAVSSTPSTARRTSTTST